MKYYKHIDGLRALAVLSVVLFHLHVSWIKSGFLGVDIFFVISGFLITRIILRDLAKHSFSLKNFYLRRMRRILPALITVLLISSIFAWLILLPQDLKNYAKSLVSALASVSNLFFYKFLNFGYFSTDATIIPLLHTWSLGVEEQFYIFWPLFLILVFNTGISLKIFARQSYASKPVLNIRWKNKDIASISSATVNISKFLPPTLLLMIFSIYLFKFSYVADKFFYYPLTRAFELLFGCMLAIYLSNNKPTDNKRFLNISAVVAVIFMLYPMVLRSVPYPSNWTIMSCVGATVYLYAGSNSNYIPFVNKIFSWKPFVGVGLISYSLYLWHWPIIAYINYLSIEKTPLVKIILLATSLALATLSYFFVEKPFRYKLKGNFVKTFILLWLLPIVVACLFALCCKYINNFGFDKPIGAYIITGKTSANSETYQYPGYEERLSKIFNFKSVWRGDGYKSPKELREIIDKNYDVVIFGDSHSQAAASMINVWAKDIKQSTLLVGGTQGVLYNMIVHKDYLEYINEVIKKAQPKIFILVGWWNAYTQHASNLHDNKQLHFLNDVLKLLEKNKIMPVIMLDWPSLKGIKPTCGMMKINNILNIHCGRNLTQVRELQSIELKYIKQLRDKYHSLTLINPKKIICINNYCPNIIGNNIIYLDSNSMGNGLNNAHLNEWGSSLIGKLYLEKYGNPLKPLLP